MENLSLLFAGEWVFALPLTVARELELVVKDRRIAGKDAGNNAVAGEVLRISLRPLPSPIRLLAVRTLIRRKG